MNERVNKLLDLLIENLEKGSDFVNSEAGLITQEIINYGRYVLGVQLILTVLLSLLFMGIAYLCTKKSMEDDWDNPFLVLGM